MSYVIAIRRNSDGRIHLHRDKLDWESDFWWKEGNGSCDCNRRSAFEKVADTYNCEVYPCNVGPNEYTVLEARLPDGTIIPLED